MNKWESETRIVTTLVRQGRPGHALAAMCIHALRAFVVGGLALAICLLR